MKNRTEKWKRLLALFMAFSMILGMLTVGAFAADEGPEALEAAVGDVRYMKLSDAVGAVNNMPETGETYTITLLRDVTLTTALELNKNVVLDLGRRYTLTVSGKNAGLQIVGLARQVTIQNGTLAGDAAELIYQENGTLRLENLSSAPNAMFTIYLSGGNTTISNCTLSSDSLVAPLLMIEGAAVTVSGSSLSSTASYATSVVYVNGGSLTVADASVTGKSIPGVRVTSGGEVALRSGATVENENGGNAMVAHSGTVTVEEGAKVYSSGTAIDSPGDATIKLNGGTFKNANVYTGAELSDADFEINGGEYTFKGTSQAHTHGWKPWTVTKAATCTEGGIERRECDCGEYETRETEAVDHTWGVWTNDVNSCTGTIPQTSTCGRCGETKHREIEGLGHVWNSWKVTKAATCTEKGSRTRTCKNCDATDTQETDMIAHSWDDGEVTAEPTETEEGVRTYTCTATACGATRTETIPVLGHEHNPSAEWSADETGHWHACSGCEEKVNKAGHTFGDWITIEDPTCTQPGRETRTCSECKFVESREISATGNHRYQINEWSSDANNHWHTCADCGIRDSEAPHTRNSGVVTVPATSTTSGTRTFSCTTCGYVLGTETIPATGGNTGTGTWSGPGISVGPTGGNNTGDENLTDPNTPLGEEPGDGEEEDLNEGDTPLVSKPFLFGDVGENKWYYSAVKYVFDRDLMKGVTETSFDPFAATNRGMLVTVLYRLDGAGDRGEVISEPKEFSDVPAGKWFTDPVLWASDKGVVNGYATGAFGPNDNVLREQVAAILYRYAQYRDCDVSARADLSGYADADRIAGYAKDAVSWAVAAGIINGVDAENLAPKGEATRVQIATMLMRFDQFLADNQPENDEEAVG